MTTTLRPAPGRRSLPTPLFLLAVLALVSSAGCGGSDTITNAESGRDVPQPAAVLTLAVQDIKTLRFSWTDTGQETGYRLLVETHGSGTRTPVATLPANTLQHDLPVFLPEQINARYTLQACNAAGCLDAATTTVETALLNGAVGYIKPSPAETVTISRIGSPQLGAVLPLPGLLIAGRQQSKVIGFLLQAWWTLLQGRHGATGIAGL